MQLPEHPVLCLPEEAERVDPERARQHRREQGPKRLRDGLGLGLVQIAAERQVELEILHHIGIAPAVQMGALTRAQPLGAAAGGFGGIGRGAKAVKVCHHLGRQRGQRRGVAVGGQRDKAAQAVQGQARQSDGGKARAPVA